MKAAIEEELAGFPAGGVSAAVAGLSERYRAGFGQYLSSSADVAAYAAFRMPATYAAAYAAFREISERMPGFRPVTLLDAGAGPGTAAWAAASIWPGLESCTFIERDAGMAELGGRLASRSPCAAVRNGQWQRADLSGFWQAGRFDAAVLSYALGELPEERQMPLIRELWEHTGGLLAVVEPGTPAGSARIGRARSLLLELGASIPAPCPHHGRCPLGEGGWCHFSARVARSRLHRQAKGAALSYEDEKFSYIAAARVGGSSPCAGRVLRHPQARKGHVLLRLCTPAGIRDVVAQRSRGDSYRLARDLKWGGSVDEAFLKGFPAGSGV